jgi:hypothetical protein
MAEILNLSAQLLGMFLFFHDWQSLGDGYWERVFPLFIAAR